MILSHFLNWTPHRKLVISYLLEVFIKHLLLFFHMQILKYLLHDDNYRDEAATGFERDSIYPTTFIAYIPWTAVA